MKDPMLLSEDASVDEALRRDLANVRGASPPPLAVDAGLERLRSSIARSPRPGAFSRWSMTGSAIWLSVTGALLLGSASMIMMRQAPHEPPPPTPVLRTDVPAADVAGGASSESEVATLSPLALPDAPSSPKTVPAKSAGPVVSARAPLERLHAELSHMRTLRELANVDPSGALAMAEEGQKRFAGGVFEQEREVIALEALQKLKRPEAKDRAARFVFAHPESPFADKVRPIAGL